MDAELRFCTNCGARLTAPEPSAEEAEVQRRTVSVLFADLVGFTALAERLDPEDLRSIQSAYFAAVRDVAEEYAGVVEKYIGDAVMAVFGAPTAHENDAYRAVRTGLELQRTLDGTILAGDTAMQLRVGVASGEAVADLHALRTGGHALITGDVVNLASRLQSVAQPGGVLVSATTYRMTSDLVEYAALPDLNLRGKSAPVQVWLARELLSRPTRDQADPSPLVGRDLELERAWGVLQSALSERRPRLLTILGPPGIGKSRLVRELHRRANAPSRRLVRWRVGHCPPYGKSTSFWALGEIVKAEAGIRDTDPAAEASRRLGRMLAPLVAPADLPLAMAALAPLVGLPATPLDQAETLAAWRAVLLAVAGTGETVLVMEDLHWAELPFLRFCESLVAEAADLPLCVIATARPEVFDKAADWGSAAGADALPLHPLDDNEVRDLFRRLLGATSVSQSSLDRLVALAGGNPLYAEEYVRMLADSGALGGDLGDAPPLPDTVQGIIASRLDLLGTSEQGVVSAASVIGSTFWPGAVIAAAGLARATVESGLMELQRRDFMQVRTDSTVAYEPECTFRHVLVRDLAYRRLPRERRAQQHHRAADWLDALTSTRSADVAELLAHHRVVALDLATRLGLDLEPYAEPAWRALRAAACQAFALHEYQPALGYAERALEVCPPQVERADRLLVEALVAELQFLDNPATFHAGGGVARLERLAEQFTVLGRPADAGRAYTLLGQIEWFRARRDPAYGYLEQALALFAGEPDSADKAQAYAELARLQMLSYRHDQAIAAAQRTVEISAGLGLTEVEGNARVTQATARYLSGDPAGVEELSAAVKFCRAGHLRALRRGLTNLATALQEEGDLRRSYALLDEMRDVGRSAGLGLATDFSDASMRAYFAGDWAAALGAADEFFGSAGAGSEPWEAQLRALCAWIRVLRGEDPGDDVELALRLAAEAGFTPIRRPALAHGALARGLQERTGEAAAMLDELATEWQGDSSVASRDWIGAAVWAATLVGAAQLSLLSGWLVALPRQTLWVQAAAASARGGLLTIEGRHTDAALAYQEAAGHYDRIGNATDSALSAAAAARCCVAAGSAGAAASLIASAADFARRNRAPRLVDGLPMPQSSSSPASMA
jgi:class 3 adenylate cyclase/tetratricopeptide (TPR) repeat protein